MSDGNFEMGEIPLTEEEIAEQKREAAAEAAKMKPNLPAQSQAGGLLDGLQKQQANLGKKQTSDNEEAHLKTKISGTTVGINTKGMSGAQKWRAALEKVEEVELTASGEKERLYDGPGAKEVRRRLRNTARPCAPASSGAPPAQPSEGTCAPPRR
jgi:hypothetical protein